MFLIALSGNSRICAGLLLSDRTTNERDPRILVSAASVNSLRKGPIIPLQFKLIRNPAMRSKNSGRRLIRCVDSDSNPPDNLQNPAPLFSPARLGLSVSILCSCEIRCLLIPRASKFYVTFLVLRGTEHTLQPETSSERKSNSSPFTFSGSCLVVHLCMPFLCDSPSTVGSFAIKI